MVHGKKVGKVTGLVAKTTYCLMGKEWNFDLAWQEFGSHQLHSILPRTATPESLEFPRHSPLFIAARWILQWQASERSLHVHWTNAVIPLRADTALAREDRQTADTEQKSFPVGDTE